MSEARQPKVDSVYLLAKLMLHSKTADRSSVQQSRHLARQIWCGHRTLKEKRPQFRLTFQGRIQDFLRSECTRLLLYFNTNKPHSFFFFFCRIPVLLENRRSSRRGGGGAHPLHPPPRSAPAFFSSGSKGVFERCS